MISDSFNRLVNLFKIGLASIVLVLPIIPSESPAAQRGPLVAIELETRDNTLDGCTACGCRAKDVLEPDRKHEWWFSFGLVQSAPQKDWESVAASSHCGSGAFDKAASDFRQTIGTPYVILDLATTPALPPEGEATLHAQVRIRKLSGFDAKGQPIYGLITQNRMLSFTTEGALTLPLFVPDPQERSSFGVHEVLLRLRATVLGREPAASYGIVSVSADVPGAEILLDGGFVGRIAEGAPIRLHNVLTGTRELRVRDFSGREVQRHIDVAADKTVEVALNLLPPPSAGSGQGLVAMGKNPQGYEEYWRAKDGVLMVRIPAGEFVMGSPEGQGEPHERPQHRVSVAAFLIDKTEVTWRQFRQFTEASGTTLPVTPVWGTPDDLPASFIVWEEAKGYCEWVGGRLPTEAEWEKAARGADGRPYPWGDKWDHERCNSRDGGPHRPEPAGSYPHCLSPYGVLDMAGSMWEWCADWYGSSYYAESPPKDPPGPTSGKLRVLRGAAWMSPFLWLRTAFRYKASPTYRNVNYGFRCAQTVQE